MDRFRLEEEVGIKLDVLPTVNDGYIIIGRTRSLNNI